MDNLRPLCFACNWKRRDEHYTDEEVLVWAQSQWEWRFGERIKVLWWLNTHMENGKAVGGTLYRSKWHERIERRARGESKDFDGVHRTGS